MSPPIGSARAGIVSQVDAIPDSGVARLTFDDADTESGTALDIWNNNDGTLNGGVTTGVSGANQTYTTDQAYSFDGSDDFVDLGTGVTPLGSFSAAIWVYSDGSTSDFRSMFADGDVNNNGNGFQLTRTNSANNDEIIFQVNSGGSNTDIFSAHSLNTWTHVVGVYDDSAGEATLYIDGGVVNTKSASYSQSSENLLIGDNPVVDNNWNGDLDDPRMYSKALTGTEVSNLYNNGSI